MRGAFTGAVADRRGKFEVADGGTIFLDEIGDMSLKTQAKVLRVLQEQTMEPVGGTTRIKVDVRVLAATNKDLQAEIRAGRFREDLYFRLNVIPIFVPPLRERQEDIPLLADHFMAEFAREYGRRVKTFEPGATAVLQQYAWPGNVRELRNVIERLMIMVPGDAISPADLGFLDQASALDAGRTAEPAGGAPDAARGARSVRARADPADARRAAGQHVAHRRSARRRAQQPVPEDARVRHRARAARGASTMKAETRTRPSEAARAVRLVQSRVAARGSDRRAKSSRAAMRGRASRRRAPPRDQADDLALQHRHAVPRRPRA